MGASYEEKLTHRPPDDFYKLANMVGEEVLSKVIIAFPQVTLEEQLQYSDGVAGEISSISFFSLNKGCQVTLYECWT